jgi:hypothetical protein
LIGLRIGYLSRAYVVMGTSFFQGIISDSDGRLSKVDVASGNQVEATASTRVNGSTSVHDDRHLGTYQYFSAWSEQRSTALHFLLVRGKTRIPT